MCLVPCALWWVFDLGKKKGAGEKGWECKCLQVHIMRPRAPPGGAEG